MRPDVKLGIVFSMAGVLVAGVYFMARGKDEAPIPLGNEALGTPDSTASQDGAVRGLSQPTGAKDPASTRRSAQPRPQPVRRGSASQPSGTPPARAERGNTPTARPGANRNPASNSSLAQRQAQRLAQGGSPNNVPGARPANDQRSGEGAAPAGGAQQPVAGPTNSSGDQPSSASASRQPVSLAAQHQAQPGELGAADRAAGVETHRAQPGDTFASLAQRYYGDVKHAGHLAAGNSHIRDARGPRSGQIVKIPPLPQQNTPQTSQPARSTAPSTGWRTYTVKAGDSFYKIAEQLLGDANRWGELFELNKELVKGDPKRLQVGAEIKLPAS